MTEAFGQALRRIRTEAGISAVELSRRTGIARSHIYRLEDGAVDEPRAEILNQLAEALEVEPEDLYELAWQTNGVGPGLPSLPTYFRAKYELEDDQIEAVERAVKRITKKSNKPNSEGGAR